MIRAKRVVRQYRAMLGAGITINRDIRGCDMIHREGKHERKGYKMMSIRRHGCREVGVGSMLQGGMRQGRWCRVGMMGQ